IPYRRYYYMSNIQKILVDAGSSTVKVYKVVKDKPELLFQKSIHFKDGFSHEQGLSPESEKDLISVLLGIIEQNPGVKINLYATALFRKMNRAAQQRL